jgi:hypothetical protein
LKDLGDLHVCIKHPTIYLPQGPYSFSSIWIGKLESIDSFYLGLLTIKPM